MSGNRIALIVLMRLARGLIAAVKLLHKVCTTRGAGRWVDMKLGRGHHLCLCIKRKQLVPFSNLGGYAAP